MLKFGGGGELADMSVDDPEVVQEHPDFRVLRSEYQLLDRQRPLVERFRRPGVAAFDLDAGQTI